MLSTLGLPGGPGLMDALVDPKLDVVDDPESSARSPIDNRKGLASGYNPYNSGALGKQSFRKKKNLKELSKWIELRKKLRKKLGFDPVDSKRFLGYCIDWS